ncbi:MAG: hypothetical protein JWL77_3067 [Chthonomonadaceae bacterium]|nr:hypothetical protein [Chthonomonadaceae bacterium]
MSGSLQAFLIPATRKAAENLEAAFLRIPEDKRAWKPMDSARTALDQAAEVAILTGHTADLVAGRKWTMGSDFSAYEKAKAELSQDWPGIQALLKTNLAKMVAAIEGVPDADLTASIEMPWGPMTLAEIMAYPYWNMAYHEGQINYIASMLGTL